MSISELNRKAKSLLENHLGEVCVEAEIGDLSKPNSGHWYFSLKDGRSQLRCAMFRRANLSVKFQPKVGDSVIVRGLLSIYEARGDYQLIVDHMEASGDGALQRQLEAGILLSLVELTCIVTGTSKGENWWCSLLAWVIAVFTILYCLLVIYTIVNSVFTYKTATKQVSELEDVSKLNKDDANEYAEALLKEEEPVTETVMPEVVEPVMPMEQVVESPPVPSPEPEPEKVQMESQQLNDDEFYSGDLTSGGYSSYGSLEQANFNLL